MSQGEIIRVLTAGFPMMPEMLDSHYPLWIQSVGGLLLTLCLTLCSLILGMVLGLALALLRQGRVAPGPDKSRRNWLVRFPGAAATLGVELVKGLPILITVLLVYYLPYALFHIRVPGVLLAIFAFSLYAGAYQCDIFQSGFRAVDNGLLEAAQVLGLSRYQTLLHIRLPIALRAMLPAMLGLAITIFKDTSVLVVVAVPELTCTARQVQMSEPRHYALVLSLVLALYWGLATLGSALTHWLETVWDAKVSK